MGPGKLWLCVTAIATVLPINGSALGDPVPGVTAYHLSARNSQSQQPTAGRAQMTAPKPEARLWPALFSVFGAPSRPQGTQKSSRLWPTSGVLDKPAESIKQGLSKVSEALSPKPPAAPANDPTLLSSKPKYTPELFISMAQFQEESGRVAAAEQAYQQAFRLAPNHLGAHLAYARFKDRQGQVEQAHQWYQKAAKLYPNEGAVFNDMGLFYARHGMNSEALAAYGRAIELQPKRALYRNNLAVLLVDLGQTDQALGHLQAVYPEAEASYKLGYLLQKKGELHQAKQYFARALALNPTMEPARQWLEYLENQSQRKVEVARRLPSVGEGWQARRADKAAEAGGGPQDLGSVIVGPPVEAGRSSVRPLPPTPRPLPHTEPEAQAAPTPEPAPVPDAAPLPKPSVRPLPPLSHGQRLSYVQEISDRLRAALEVQPLGEEPADAPLPTVAPPSPVGPRRSR